MRPYRGLTKEGKEIRGWYCKVEGKSYIILDDAETGFDFDSSTLGIMGFIEVDPKTVGQYTDLHDKDGKELDWWEDDIVRDKRKYINKKERVFQIVSAQGCFRLKSIRGKSCLTCESMAPYLNNGFVKVGNIHENSELIEEKE